MEVFLRIIGFLGFIIPSICVFAGAPLVVASLLDARKG